MSTASIPNRPAGSDSRSIAQILANFDSITNFLNGQNLDPSNFSEALVNEKLGLSDSNTVRRGAFSQATAGTRTNTAYGALNNGPDVVPGIVVPANARVIVIFSAIWQSSSGGAGRAALFFGANQATTMNASGAPTVAEALNSTANDDEWLFSDSTPGSGGPIQSLNGNGNATPAGAGIPIMVGREAVMKIDPGVYDVSVQYKSATGSVTVKNRELLVKVEAW